VHSVLNSLRISHPERSSIVFNDFDPLSTRGLGTEFLPQAPISVNSKVQRRVADQPSVSDIWSSRRVHFRKLNSRPIGLPMNCPIDIAHTQIESLWVTSIKPIAAF
jgi:hypothetical protein